MKKLLMALMVLGVLGSLALAQAQEAPIVPDSIIVVFHGQTLPADAEARVQHAGGEVVDSLTQVGALVVRPFFVDGATLIQNLRSDSAVLDADYDREITLIAPDQVSSADDGADDDGADDDGADNDFAHPLPQFSPTLRADHFYTSTPQQWSIKRVGAMGEKEGLPLCGLLSGCAGAWDVTKGKGSRIAILDTGVTEDHPDIAPNLVAIKSVIPRGDVSPCEVKSPEAEQYGDPRDQHGHGTWTASIAAGAAGAGTGLVVGVAPEASIISIKVLQREARDTEGKRIEIPTSKQCLDATVARGRLSWVLKGIEEAHRLGANVISMSLGFRVQRSNQDLLPEGGAVIGVFNRSVNSVTSKGVVLVASTGNEETNLNTLESFVRLPAQSPNVIAVTATANPSFQPVPPGCLLETLPGPDCLASYSNFGSSLHGLAAPGGTTITQCLTDFSGNTSCVRGACSAGIPGTTSGLPSQGGSFGCFQLAGRITIPGQPGQTTTTNHRWYAQSAGTSAAAPHVAGVAALVKAANPALNAHQIRAILQQTAEDIGPVGYDEFFNFGMVDATAAVLQALPKGAVGALP